jgi:uncharacterized protein YceK
MLCAIRLENGFYEFKHIILTLIAKVKEKTMAKKTIFWVMLVMALAFGMIVSGCSTTHSITYASAEQPNGYYKFVVISTVSVNASVLQRFYEMYPSSQYEVVAYEKQEKKWLPLVAGLGGGFVGGLVGGLVGMGIDTKDLAPALIIGGSTCVCFAVLGYFIGDLFKENYVVTYVERASSLSE